MLRYAKVKFYQRGIVLIAVLLFLSIFSLLGLYAIENSVRQTKITREDLGRYIMRESAEYLLRQVALALPQAMPTCLITVMPASEIAKQPLQWWKIKGCGGNFRSFQYYYVTEFIGTDTCAYMNPAVSENKAITVADYYRITLFVSREEIGEKIFLQSVVVRPNSVTMPCEASSHFVVTGSQSFRELTAGY